MAAAAGIAVLAHAALIGLLGASVELGKAVGPSMVPTLLLQGIDHPVSDEVGVEAPPAVPPVREASGQARKPASAKPAAVAGEPVIAAIPEEPAEGAGTGAAVAAGPPGPAMPQGPSPGPGTAAGDPATGEGGGGPAGTQAPDTASVLEQIRAKLQASLVYPPMARIQGIEGTVQLRFSVGSDGKPTGVQVVKSSGFDVLDDAALATLEKAAPLPQVAVKIKVPVVYDLEQ